MRFRDALLRLAPLAPLAALGCTPSPRPAETAPTTIHIDPVGVASDPVARARFVPIDVPAHASFGLEPGGGARSIAAGVRVVKLPGGGVLTAEERLPGARWDVLVLPDRLGGGFLFRVDDRSIWRAEKWLGPARPIYISSAPIVRIALGLDRVYVLARGTIGEPGWRAIDGETGAPKPLGPWPTSPSIGSYAAADGWRALAVADLRGIVATSDAGATWRTLPLPIEPRDVTVKGDSLEVRGTEGRVDVTYELRADGQMARISDAPRAASDAAQSNEVEPLGPLGAHPLEVAVDDGWPLGEGTALVARDGALSRVRLEDGAVVESVPGAYPLRPSRCHPVPLGGARGFGFVCGEPRGATIVYAFDATASHGAMTELRRFDAPRAVLASGNGALVVRGPCDAHAAGDGDPEAHHYCVRTLDGAWSEIRVEGGVGSERVAVLADGRFAIVSPPKGNLDSGRLTIVEKGRAESVPIVFAEGAPGPEPSVDLSRVMAMGVWLDGIEERRPGVLGGWIEASGTMLGFELSLDGKARLGALVRGEHSLPMVSGRYGLGWSGARTGYETTDGGMTWKTISVPEPIKPLRAITSRACGPVGCSAAGWLRIGWGAASSESSVAPHQSLPSLPRSYLSLALECTADGGSARAVPREPAGNRTVRRPDDLLGPPPPVAASPDARLVTLDTMDTRGTGPTGRMVVWGPKSSEWGPGARWVVRWAWPFGGASDVRSSAAAPAPPLLVDAVRGVSGSLFPLGWSVALGDDPSHALLFASRRNARAEGTVFELEGDRVPVEIRRAGGEPLGEIEAALRVAGRWYVATPGPLSPTQGGRIETVVWQVDGSVARELAHIPRTPSPDGHVGAGRLAGRAGGGALGYVVDGQPPPERSEATRWVAPIDLDTGAIGEIEPLGSVDFGDRSVLSLCTNDDAGWSMDLPLEGPSSFPILLSSQGTALGGLHGAFARVRLGRGRTCLERLAGTLAPSIDAMTAPRSATPHHPSVVAPASITVTVGDRSERSVFRCGVR
jgi:hypothetical protein